MQRIAIVSFYSFFSHGSPFLIFDKDSLLKLFLD
jgi:hypothetical protein